MENEQPKNDAGLYHLESKPGSKVKRILTDQEKEFVNLASEIIIKKVFGDLKNTMLDKGTN